MCRGHHDSPGPATVLEPRARTTCSVHVLGPRLTRGLCAPWVRPHGLRGVGAVLAAARPRLHELGVRRVPSPATHTACSYTENNAFCEVGRGGNACMRGWAGRAGAGRGGMGRGGVMSSEGRRGRERGGGHHRGREPADGPGLGGLHEAVVHPQTPANDLEAEGVRTTSHLCFNRHTHQGDRFSKRNATLEARAVSVPAS